MTVKKQIPDFSLILWKLGTLNSKDSDQLSLLIWAGWSEPLLFTFCNTGPGESEWKQFKM